MNLLNKILSYLPFDGDKTKLGVILAIITIVQNVLADPQWADFLSNIKLHQWVPALIILIGLFHKYVKAKSA